MDQYQIILPENITAVVLHKRIGVRRPHKFLFFKVRDKEQLIAYTALLQSGQKSETVEIFKSWKNGEWIDGLLKDGKKINTENEITQMLKKEIDRYETMLGENAYTRLF